MATWSVNVTAVDGSVTIYNLSDKNPFKVLEVSGIGNAEVRRLEERGPFQTGVTDTGYRVDARIINLTILIYGSSASDIDTQRDKLSNIFSPIADQPIRLKVTRDDATVRQIDCYVVGMVDQPAQLTSRILNTQRVVVQLKAPDPIWYDPVIATLGFTAVGTDPTWYTGGGVIGTASIAYYGTGISSGGTVVNTTLGSGLWTIMYRSQRPTSGTALPYDMRQTSTYRATTPIAIGSANLRFEQKNAFGFGATVVDGTYQNSSGSIVAVSNGFANGARVHQFTDAGSATLLAAAAHLYENGNGTVTWRQNRSGGSVWSNTMSHAAIYNIELSLEQQRAVATLMGAGATAFLGTAVNAGNWDEYPIITLNGPIYNPTITNLATGEALIFAGTISDTSSWTIDTRYGYKTVTQGGSSVIDRLSDDSDLATFHLQPGANPLTVSATGGTSSLTQINLQYYNRYISS